MDTFILAVQGRDAAHERLQRSLLAADVKATWLFNPALPMPARRTGQLEHLHTLSHWSTEEHVLVLEDDAIVNEHLLWNVQTWPALRHPDFGAGWLWNPGGYAGFDCWYNGTPEWYGAVGVVYRTKDLRRLVDWMCLNPLLKPSERVEYHPLDVELSAAVHRGLGKKIRVHYPALIEHLDDLPSIVGNTPNPRQRTSCGTFDPTWKRSASPAR
jgi:hypothetical protein